MDTTSAGSDYETTIGFYNVRNSRTANLTNEALKLNAVTLSRTDLITFQYEVGRPPPASPRISPSRNIVCDGRVIRKGLGCCRFG